MQYQANTNTYTPASQAHGWSDLCEMIGYWQASADDWARIASDPRSKPGLRATALIERAHCLGEVASLMQGSN